MSYTKRQLILDAYEEIGIASYNFDLQTEQIDAACRKLDRMMGEWDGKGLKFAYPLASSPGNINLDLDTLIPNSVRNAIVQNLAVALAPSMGKVVSPQTLAGASMGYSSVCALCTQPKENQFPSSMPLGAGNKPWRVNDPFVQAPTDQDLPPPEQDLTFS